MANYDRTDEWDLDRGLPTRRPSESGLRDRQGGRSAASEYRRPSDGRNGYASAGDQRMAAARKRRRKKQQQIKKVILTIMLTIIIVGLLGAAAYILMQHLPKEKSEQYTREIDLTDSLAGNIAVWLSTVDGEDINAEWVKERSGSISVSSKLLLAKDSDGNATFDEKIDEASYAGMQDSVNAVLEAAMAEIIAEKLMESGYAESVSKEEASAIAERVLGMSISDYINANGVSVVPSIDVLNRTYTLGSGNYRISKGSINLKPSEGDIHGEKVIKRKDSLVLVDSGKIYIKGGESNE